MDSHLLPPRLCSGRLGARGSPSPSRTGTAGGRLWEGAGEPACVCSRVLLKNSTGFEARRGHVCTLARSFYKKDLV